MNWDKSAGEILKGVGGKENIVNLVHCATRLRFVVADSDKVKKEEVEKIEGVISSQWSGKQYQVIIGQDVATPYKKLLVMLDMNEQPVVPDEKEEDKGSLFERIIDTISGIFVPILSAIVGCAMIKTLLVLLTTFHLLSAESQTYLILSFVSDTVFYFMPVFLAISAAKKFNMNTFVAGVIGAMLIHPNFVAMVSTGEELHLFGVIPVTLVSYSSSVIPAVLSVWIASFVETWMEKISPKAIKFFFVPFATIVIMVPITFCAVGPLGTWVGKVIAAGIGWLDTNVSWAIPFVFGAFAQVIILTGMHYVVTIPLVLSALAVYGYDTIGAGFLCSNMACGFGALAVGLIAKNKDFKALALSTGVSSLLCVNEPCLYGVHLKLKKPFLALMIGGGAGGLLAGIVGLKRITFASTSLLTLPIFVDPNNGMNFVWAIVCSLVSGLVSFALTIVLCKRDKEIMKEIGS